ncbi:MAG: hypothetical protein WC966_02990 [Bradymonadales bacterium]|jgi:hypothetical protein
MKKSLSHTRYKLRFFAALSHVFLIAALATACNNEQQAFCNTAAKALCEKCAACQPDGLRHCGMMDKQNQEGCEKQYIDVCRASDDVFNVELSRTCLDRIERTNCEQIRKEGKPDVCNRLF